MDSNLRLFNQIYKATPNTASEFGALLSNPPPSATCHTVFTFSDRTSTTSKPLGWSILYYATDAMEATGAVFMPLHSLPGAFERSIEAIWVIWWQAMDTGFRRVDTRTVPDRSYGVSEGMHGFDLVGIAKRYMITQKTEVYDQYTITSARWPDLKVAGEAWLFTINGQESKVLSASSPEADNLRDLMGSLNEY